MFVNFFIHRPVFATVCALMIILGGAVVIPTLPIAQFPNLTPPTVSVNSFYIGASAQTVESAVTIPLEQAINGAEGMRYISSVSGNDGSSSITVTFELNRDPDLAAVDVQNRVNIATGRLPAAVKTTGVIVTKASNNFVFGAAVYSPDSRYDPLFMSNYLDLYVRDALKRIPGVADVFVFGERRYSMRLWLDPQRLASRGLTASDAVAALQEQNVEIAAGSVGQPPALPGLQYQMSVRAMGRLTQPQQFDNIILKTSADGTLVRLKDVGRAELGAEDYSSILRYKGVDSVGLGVTQLSKANALEVRRLCYAELERLKKRFPPGMVLENAFDTTEAVSESIKDVLITLAEAIGLVILVIFIFLEDWRSTIVPGVTIPVSLIGTFLFVKLLGFSINTLTLFGITLATGLVVDDAIVVIENIERHIQEGEHNSHKAASMAMAEVAGAVIATSLVLVAVFVPVAFFPGTTGILFRQFALTIAFSIAISAFNALTLSPALSAILLGKVHGTKSWIFRQVDKIVAAVTHGYRRGLHGLLDYKFAAVVLFFGGLGATYFVYRSVPTAFVPQEDQGYFVILVQSPPGASLEYTAAIEDEVHKFLVTVPEIETDFAVSGFSLTGTAPNFGVLFVGLKPYSQRRGVEHNATSVVNRIRGPLFTINGAMVLPFEPPAVEGVGSFGGFQYELQDLGGHTPADLARVVMGVMGGAAGHKTNGRSDLTGVYSSYTANDPQFLVTIDREKTKSMRVPLQQVTDALGVYMGSAYVNDFDFNNRAYRVYLQADKEFRASPQNIREYYVRSENGAMVPLDNLVAITQTTTPQTISHYNLFRSAEVNGSPAPGFSSGQGMAAMDDISKQVLPQGFAYEWTGLSLEELASGRTTALLFGLGILVVYLTLSAQYESFVLPFIVLLAVPMAILGAMGAVWLRGALQAYVWHEPVTSQNDIFCQVGLVMLIGLASKNAILIVEFAEQLRERGLPLMEATVEAARIRLRPILMTSFAFILGVVPLMLATGAGSAGRHSVGTTVFGGMLMSTVLNLFFIPVLYMIIEGWREKSGVKIEHR